MTNEIQAPAPAHDKAVTHGQVGDLWRELGLPELMSWQWERLHQRFIPAIVRSVATSAPAVKPVPLTPSQIETGRAAWGGERFDFTEGVRFAERAHGIGEGKPPVQPLEDSNG